MRKRIIMAVLALLAAFAARSLAALPDRGTFFSEALGTEKAYRIYLPPSYEKDAAKRYPVVYLLHGYNFVRNNPDKFVPQEEENHWMDQEQVGLVAGCLFTVADYDALLACLVKNNVGLPDAIVAAMKVDYPKPPLPLPEIIIVMPDGDSSFYMNREDGLKQWPAADGPDFVDGVRKGATGQYETYIAKDLVKYIDATYRTLADRDHRGIGGFSMGGIGSMNLLLGNPDVYVSVTSLSALYTLSDMLNDPFSQSYMKQGTPEIASVLSANPAGKDSKIDKEYLKKNDPYFRLRDLQRMDVKIYYDAGSNDTFAGMKQFASFKKFQAGLEKKGLASAPALHIIPATELNANGMHTARYWRSRIGNMLAFHDAAFGLLK
jgi:S-formylglutathione hydrolase FrmB